MKLNTGLKMKIVFSLLAILALLLFTACGSKRNPTGGEADTVKPTVLSSAPAEMGDISSGLIEIDFSKAMDKNSINNAIYIYPPVGQRSISLSKATLSIQIKETLKADTNYYITLSTRLKDLRGNPLDKDTTLIFKSGKANNASLSGLILQEDSADAALPVKLSLFSADSLLVMMQEISGSSYALNNLNPANYSLRAYIDKNLNGRYDITQEPSFESTFEVMEKANLDLQMAYTDTTQAQIKKINQISPHELEIQLSKAIKSYSSVNISAEDSPPLNILHQYLNGNKLYVLCSEMDSTRYTAVMVNMQDAKGGISSRSSLSFEAKNTKDSTPPRLLSTNPRNGATVNSLKPEIRLVFSEIITKDKFKAKLYATDSKQDIPFEVSRIAGRELILIPSKDLVNFRSHTLKILSETTDYSGNKLEKDTELLFLPLQRK